MGVAFRWRLGMDLAAGGVIARWYWLNHSDWNHNFYPLQN